MVHRIYVEKKEAYNQQAKRLLTEIKTQLHLSNLNDLRIIQRYDVENINKTLFEKAITTVFSEPPVDKATTSFVKLEVPKDATLIATEPLPGQFDQRADSAAQCIQLISTEEKPIVRHATIYALCGNLTSSQVQAIKSFLINPVECREAQLTLPDTLKAHYPKPDHVALVDDFTTMNQQQLWDLTQKLQLAMSIDDLHLCQDYFKSLDRPPTIAEIKTIDTYWSDHCRHTTFNTVLDKATFKDPVIEDTFKQYLDLRQQLGITKPITLMDLATISAKHLQSLGKLQLLDQSDEINACTVKVNLTVDGKEEPWLLLFKNETHNHPTEIEPFGGASTCLGGCIRDPLSGRSYVYGAMRLSGSGNPLAPIENTLQGKLPQRVIAQKAAEGYSSYGNQIGIATGIVDEIYHSGYLAKRMEVGAVIGAAPASNVIRMKPQPGDVVVLLGGATGRDGIGGATGSSKAHNAKSVEECGAQVQKGNPPEERKIQRLFKNPQATRLIKRCNDFGAGGVAVAIGELADGISINLDQVPLKYEGLDGTEIAISESQERMACVIGPSDLASFIQLASQENLNCVQVGIITEEKMLTMDWNGQTIINIHRDFLNSAGCSKHTEVLVEKPGKWNKTVSGGFQLNYMKMVSSLNCCSKVGLSQRFDSTIGAATVLMPYGGAYQQTPIQAMVHKFPIDKGQSDDCSYMSWGFNPYISEKSPFHGAYLAVTESISKLIATGCSLGQIYLSFQEYFPSLKKDPTMWGLPMAALLGAFKAQVDLQVASIGGKDSMSGSFEDLHVPPTLISFAVGKGKASLALSPEFKQEGNQVLLLEPKLDPVGLPDPNAQSQLFQLIWALNQQGLIHSAFALSSGGIAEAVFKMAIGNQLGFLYNDQLQVNQLFSYNYGAFLIEVDPKFDWHKLPASMSHYLAKIEGQNQTYLINDLVSSSNVGTVTADQAITLADESIALAALMSSYEDKLEPIYPRNANAPVSHTENFSFSASSWPSPAIKCAAPRVLIPVFPGTNCELDSAKAFEAAGAKPEILVINNCSGDDIKRSISRFSRSLASAQILFIPGGFSGGDEPDGSAKFIAAFLRNQQVQEGLARLLDQEEGLVAGICNGFQALIKVGLLPYGKITELQRNSPTLTYNSLGVHQSRIVRTRIASNKSPWLKSCQVGETYLVPVSHGEGRFVATEKEILQLGKNGQIATQYVDFDDNASVHIDFNPNNSFYSVEGITSPDGRIFGKMGHSERTASGLYKNVPGNYNINMFKNAVEYFK